MLLSPVVAVIVLAACVIAALLVGYFVGRHRGRAAKTVEVREIRDTHGVYKNDVREHFEQTSAIMSRMVEDYRDMYEHMSVGAEKLADIHPEKRVKPPPAPEAITREAGAAPDRERSGPEDSGAEPRSNTAGDARPSARASQAAAGTDSRESGAVEHDEGPAADQDGERAPRQ